MGLKSLLKKSFIMYEDSFILRENELKYEYIFITTMNGNFDFDWMNGRNHELDSDLSI